MSPSEKLIQLLSRERYCIFDIQCCPINIWKIRLRVDDRACEVQAEHLEQAFREILRYLSYSKLEIPCSNLPILESKFNTLALSYAKMKKYHSYHTRLSYNWITNRWTLMLVFGIPCLMVEHPKLDKAFEMFNDYLTCETTKMAENSIPIKEQTLIQKFDSLDNELLDEIPISRFINLYPRLSVNHEPDFVERILNGETLYSISYHFKKK